MASSDKLNVLIPEWTRKVVERIFASHLEDWPALLRSLRSVGEELKVENVSQAAQFVESGNTQAGFVALAHAAAPSMQGKGKYWIVPADYYAPLAQGVVILSHSSHKKEAEEFLQYFKTKPVSDTLQKYGFTLPPSQ